MKYVSFRSFWTDFDSRIFLLNCSYSFKHRIQLYLNKQDLYLLTFIELYIRYFLYRITDCKGCFAADEIVQKVKLLVTKSDNLSSIPGPTRFKERIDSLTLFSGFHMHTVAFTPPSNSQANEFFIC